MNDTQSSASTTSESTIAIRDDVHATVQRLIQQAPGGNGIDAWRHYSHAKETISKRCGWDARDETYDEQQYILAVHAYLAGVGL